MVVRVSLLGSLGIGIVVGISLALPIGITGRDTMAYNRNDISIAITITGCILAAQGNPAITALRERDDIADVEHGLYYAQLPHRAGWRSVDGSLHIGCPSIKPAGSIVYVIGRPSNMCGTPTLVAKI